MSRMLVHGAGQRLAAMAARIVPDIVAGIARGTRIPADRLRSARDVPLLPRAAAHDHEKSIPVFGKDHAQTMR
jgi:hypoxanthine phosphoribosyltransferase